MWFKLMNSFANHRKVRKVSRDLGCPVPHAAGYIVSFLCEVSRQAPDGCLTGWDVEDIEEAAMWDGATGVLAGSMSRHGWFVEGENGPEVNDWMEYAQGYRMAERARLAREGKKNKQKTRFPEYVQNTALPLKNKSKSSNKDPIREGERDRETERKTEREERNDGEERRGERGKEREDGEERKTDGEESEERGRKPKTASELRRKKRHPRNSDAELVAKYYQLRNPTRGANLKPGTEVFGLIRDRLDDGYSVEYLKTAVDGILANPWHVSKGVLSAKYIFRNAESVEKFYGVIAEPENRKMSDPIYQGTKEYMQEEGLLDTETLDTDPKALEGKPHG